MRRFQAGHVVIDGSPIELQDDRYLPRFRVWRDVLRVGKSCDSVRVAVACRTHRQIAAELNAVLPATRISDLVWLHATEQL